LGTLVFSCFLTQVPFFPPDRFDFGLVFLGVLPFSTQGLNFPGGGDLFPFRANSLFQGFYRGTGPPGPMRFVLIGPRRFFRGHGRGGPNGGRGNPAGEEGPRGKRLF